MQEQATSSLPSSSERSSSSAAHQMETKEGMESEEESRRVPDFGGGPSGRGASSVEASNKERGSSKGRGKRSAADKEHKRLKRLLRNRVSAQQARERKKAYLTDLEAKVKNLESSNLELEEKLTTLQNENQMLRHILKNTTRRGSGGNTSGGEPSP